MNEIIFSKEKIQDFIRYEITFEQLTGANDPRDILIRCEGRYQISFDDCLAAFRHMLEKKISYIDLYQKWYEVIVSMADEVNLSGAFGYEGTSFGNIDFESAMMRLPFNREAALCMVFGMLYQIPFEPEINISDFADIHEYLDILECVVYNEELPIQKWHLTLMQKMRFLIVLAEKREIDLVDQPLKDLFRNSLEEMCEKGMYDALRIKAYCCLFGNTVYEKDYPLAKEYLEILVDEMQDVYAANALGYMYEKGLGCDPDYETAYAYYSVAAFADVEMAALHVADCLETGRGCPRSNDAAMHQVRMIYTKLKRPFIEGDYGCCFAEAAYRMGNYCRFGIGTGEDQMLAYSYYLDAMNALNQRMHYEQTQMDEELKEKLQNAIGDMEATIGGFIHDRENVLQEPVVLDRILSGGIPLEMHVQPLENDECLIILQRADHLPGNHLLLTVESMSYSRLKEKIVLIVKGFHWIDGERKEPVSFGSLGYNVFTKTTVLYANGQVAASFHADAFVFTDDRPDEWQDEEPLDFVRIQKEDGKREDYMNAIPGLKSGDHVLVEDGEGVVVNAFSMRKYEMPEKKYLHVIQKIMSHRLS